MLIAWHPLEKIFDGDSLPLADVAGVCQDQRGSTEDIALEKRKKKPSSTMLRQACLSRTYLEYLEASDYI